MSREAVSTADVVGAALGEAAWRHRPPERHCPYSGYRDIEQRGVQARKHHRVCFCHIYFRDQAHCIATTQMQCRRPLQTVVQIW